MGEQSNGRAGQAKPGRGGGAVKGNPRMTIARATSLAPRTLAAFAAAIALLVALTTTPTATASNRADATALAAYSDFIWTSAKSGAAEDALQLFDQLPAGLNDDESLGDYAKAVTRFRENVQARESNRAERQAELREELAAYPDELDVRKALAKVLELHILARDKQALLDDPEIARVLAAASERAAEHEANGNWLLAQNIYGRLNALHEEDRRYLEDLERLNRRLLMLNLYVPERFHQMRSDLRVEEDEDPLPPYNDIGPDWREKLQGINRTMVLRAMHFASEEHVDGAPDQLGKAGLFRQMLKGGVDAVRTFITTEDLADAFPSINRNESRERFINWLETAARDIRIADDQSLNLAYAVTLVRGIQRTNEQTLGIPDEALLHEFGNGFTSQLDDYSAIIWPDELREFAQQTRGDFHGVGIQISLNDALELEVVAPISGTPAAQAGIRAGDVITRIDGEDTTGIALSQAVDRITGDKGTPVTLTIRRETLDEPFDVRLVRDEIPLHAVKGWMRNGPEETDWDYMIDPDNGVGYVRLTRFNEKASSELRDAIREMQRNGLSAIILDLRYNPGGLLTEAVNVANLFVGEGLIVKQADRVGNLQDQQFARRSRAVLEDIPMVVLVNGGSASASEIVAGALKQHGRAVVVGERTFGKGSVQTVNMIVRNLAALKLTTQLYLLPNGESIHKDDNRPRELWGVKPNITVEMLPDQISDWLELRRDADVVDIDEEGRMASEPIDPSPLIDDGIDLQLETALLLLRNRVEFAKRIAELSDADTDNRRRR